MTHPLFPNSFTEPFIETSPEDLNYNCVAWAVGDVNRWWEPDPDCETTYWPTNVPQELTIHALKLAYQTLNFKECNTGSFEQGIHKIAIFSTDKIYYSHVCKQIDTLYWSSKLGRGMDVKHTLFSLENGLYGDVVCFMQKQI